MNKDFYTAIKDRRTYYSIGKSSPITDEKIIEVVKNAVLHAPSAFNSQSGRAVVLLGVEHDALWNIVLDTLRMIVPADKFGETEAKINGFRNGYGTVMFFEDQAVVTGLQEAFKLYKDNFPPWSLQSSGMLQHIVWTSLEMEGFGASLQHYNPLIDNEVKEHWQIPASWSLLGQMPFGTPTAGPGEKEFQPIEDRVKVYR